MESDEEAIGALRMWLSYLPSNWQEQPPQTTGWPAAEPARPIEEIVPDREEVPFDVNELIEAIVDEATFFPYKDLFAQEIACGFARLGGRPVGVLANQSHAEGWRAVRGLPRTRPRGSSGSATRSTCRCCSSADNAGYMIGSDVERAGIIRHGAKMLFAVCEADVPRICVVVRKAYGGGYLAMSGSPTKPDAVLALPTAKVALMGPAAAVNAIHYNRIVAIEDPDERKAYVEAEQSAKYEADIDVFKLASENAFEEVVPAARLREDLIARFATYAPSAGPRRRAAQRRVPGLSPAAAAAARVTAWHEQPHSIRGR